MEKKYYYAPEVKFHQLRIKSMIALSEGGQGNDDEDLSKAFGSFSFDEDED